MQFCAGMTHVWAPVSKIDSCSRDNGCKLESSPICYFCSDLLGFVIPAQICYSLQLVSSGQTQRWVVCGSKAESSPNIFENWKHLWPVIYESQSLNFKQQAKGRDPNSGGSFCRPRLVLVKLTDADGVVSIAAPVLWCWWWHQCFGVTLVSDKRGAVSPPDVGHQGHLGGIVLW